MYSGGWEFDYQFASGQLCYRRPADSKQMPSGYLHSNWFESQPKIKRFYNKCWGQVMSLTPIAIKKS